MNSIQFNVIDGLNIHSLKSGNLLVTSLETSYGFKINVVDYSNPTELILIHSCIVNSAREAVELLPIFAEQYLELN